jgi:cell wall-associated NlpC family hydrolase
VRHFFIILSLGGVICMADNGRAKSENIPANDPAWTGEPNKKVVAPAISHESVSTNHSPSDISAPVISLRPAPPKTAPVTESRVATITTTDLKEYADQPEVVQRLIAQGLALINLNLFYKYGSSDPKNGGMDCSGTVYYLLNQAGLKGVPRDASGMYRWVWKESHFQSVVSSSTDTFELGRLKPGDLLFWTGTYRVDHDPPVTHVMIYLGTNRRTGQRVMMGASEGRPFDGKSRYGVSVFDFKISGVKRKQDSASIASPEAELETRFIGYGSIPGLEEAGTDTGLKKSNSL